MDLAELRSLSQKETLIADDGILTVSALNRYISSLFANDAALTDIRLRGEISNFKAHSSGHLYFSLKDEEALISAVMFRSAASRLRFRPENGMKVLLRGSVSVYVRDGKYQIYVNYMEPDGIGDLYLAFEQRKRRLAEEGVFAPERKRPLPRYPRRIGLITSPTGAAVRDMLNILGRRYPMAEVVLYPALVQGDEAPATLINGLRYFGASHSVDVIIIGRGGGSMEDLFAFNDEALCRAVSASVIPVISAVGHETDFTLCDFAADCRAPTPSAAAELAVPDATELRARITSFSSKMRLLLANTVKTRRRTLELLASRPVLRDPAGLLGASRMRLDGVAEHLGRAATASLSFYRNRMAEAAARLNALSPLAVLSRGYALTRREDGTLLTSVREAKVGERMELQLADGRAVGRIEEIIPADETERNLSNEENR